MSDFYSARPQIEGHYRFIPSSGREPHRLVKAQHGPQGLGWELVDSPQRLRLAGAGYQAYGQARPGCFARTEVARQYAANLMLRYHEALPCPLREAAPERVLIETLLRRVVSEIPLQHQGANLISFGIAQGLEVDRPYLATIEHMLAVASRLDGMLVEQHPQKGRFAGVDVLLDLRDGVAHEKSEQQVLDQIISLCKTHGIYDEAYDRLMASLEPEPTDDEQCDFACSDDPYFSFSTMNA